MSKYLNYRQHRRHQIEPNVLEQLLQSPSVRLRILFNDGITLTLIPQKRSEGSTTATTLLAGRSPSPPHHAPVEEAPPFPLADIGPADGAGHQPNGPEGAGLLGQDRVGKRHRRPNPVGARHVDVGVERLVSFDPVQFGVEAEYGRVRATRGGDDAVPDLSPGGDVVY
ncbi:hypothetical protein PanWU01x14_233950 [Parasponia andersonii]|uniref:Uncharacterized protein n=1 Tax=Parasponia andersonii TaxID=3476 RepID=A0A2P5BJ91_PARAD|nr:hypothetical protein PanWU01x14_233950 [Parasponia andersonii]